MTNPAYYLPEPAYVFPPNPADCSLEILEEYAIHLVMMIESIPAPHLNLSKWTTAPAMYNPARPTLYHTAAHIHSCGSVACLGGWSAVYPPIVAMGGSALLCGAPKIWDRCADDYLLATPWGQSTIHTDIIQRLFSATNLSQHTDLEEAIHRARSLLSAIRYSIQLAKTPKDLLDLTPLGF